MADTVRLFVGTDQRMKPAEIALERSVRAHSSLPVEINWLRQGDDGFSNWALQPDLPHPPNGWATGFTCFRYAVPELAGFEGRAIWMDTDMVVLGDIAELWRWPTNRPWFTQSFKRTDVSIIDCAPFKKAVDEGWWPTIEKMKAKGVMGSQLRTVLRKHNFLQFGLPEEWNSLDRYTPDKTKLIHFTAMSTQPWKPWPERFSYPPHPDKKATEIFWEWAQSGDPA